MNFVLNKKQPLINPKIAAVFIALILKKHITTFLIILNLE